MNPMGTACGFSFEDAGEELHFITFFPAVVIRDCPGSASVELCLDEIHINDYSCRESVYHSSHALYRAIPPKIW